MLAAELTALSQCFNSKLWNYSDKQLAAVSPFLQCKRLGRDVGLL